VLLRRAGREQPLISSAWAERLLVPFHRGAAARMRRLGARA
jgi:hypothetical protein